jgi:hypothetical protein
MSKFNARMLAMLALRDKELATHGRTELVQRYTLVNGAMIQRECKTYERYQSMVEIKWRLL